MTNMFKRVFSRKNPKSVSKSIRCPEMMWEAFESLAEQTGESANSFIVMVLDQYLQVQVEQGKIKIPVEKENKITA